MPSEAELGYVAGIIDGEGCISLNKRLSKVRYLIVAPQVRIYNTDEAMLLFVQDVVGGVLSPWTPRENGRKAVKVLRWTSKRTIKELLDLVLPYLVIKKEQAEALLEWCNSPHGSKNPDLVERVCQLNKKGA